MQDLIISKERCKTNWNKNDICQGDTTIYAFFHGKLYLKIIYNFRCTFFFAVKDLFPNKKLFPSDKFKILLGEGGINKLKVILEICKICFLKKLFFCKMKRKKLLNWEFMQELGKILQITSTIKKNYTNKFKGYLKTNKTKTKIYVAKNLIFFFFANLKPVFLLEKIIIFLILLRKEKNNKKLKKILKLLYQKTNFSKILYFPLQFINGFFVQNTNKKPSLRFTQKNILLRYNSNFCWFERKTKLFENFSHDKNINQYKKETYALSKLKYKLFLRASIILFFDGDFEINLILMLNRIENYFINKNSMEFYSFLFFLSIIVFFAKNSHFCDHFLENLNKGKKHFRVWGLDNSKINWFYTNNRSNGYQYQISFRKKFFKFFFGKYITKIYSQQMVLGVILIQLSFLGIFSRKLMSTYVGIKYFFLAVINSNFRKKKFFFFIPDVNVVWFIGFEKSLANCYPKTNLILCKKFGGNCSKKKNSFQTIIKKKNYEEKIFFFTKNENMSHQKQCQRKFWSRNLSKSAQNLLFAKNSKRKKLFSFLFIVLIYQKFVFFGQKVVKTSDFFFSNKKENFPSFKNLIAKIKESFFTLKTCLYVDTAKTFFNIFLKKYNLARVTECYSNGNIFVKFKRKKAWCLKCIYFPFGKFFGRYCAFSVNKPTKKKHFFLIRNQNNVFQFFLLIENQTVHLDKKGKRIFYKYVPEFIDFFYIQVVLFYIIISIKKIPKKKFKELVFRRSSNAKKKKVIDFINEKLISYFNISKGLKKKKLLFS